MLNPLRARMVITLVLAMLGLSLSVAGPASAHDRLLKSDPADGSTVTAAEKVTLTYSDEILPTGTRVEVKAPDGSIAASGKPEVKGKQVIQRVDATSAGRFSVTWRVTSSDGHPISGTFSFTVKGDGAESASPTKSASGQTWATTGSSESGTSDERTLPPTEQVGTDETRNEPWLIIGLAVATLVVVAGGALYARGRLRDDE